MQSKRTPVEYIGLVLRGICMGASDIVPGVSGGTMAFILGIYAELIDSIRAFSSPEFIQAVLGKRVKEAVQIVNLPFLIAVASGIGIAILSFSAILEHWLETQPILLFAFFFGLVIASILTVIKRVGQWNPLVIGTLLIGAIGAFIFVGLVPAETPEAWWFLILTGAIVICAMILPGISGSFLLLLLGKYQYILGAVNDRNIMPILLVMIGAIIGILTFSHVIGWVFERYNDLAVAFLTGLMIGSLRKIWPWKNTLETKMVDHGDYMEEVAIRFENYIPSFGTDTDLLVNALLLAVVAIVFIFVIDRIANRVEA